MFAPLYFSVLLFPLPSKIYHLWVSYLLFWTAANTTHSVKVRLQLLDFSIVPSLPYPLCHCSTTAPAGRAGKSLPQEQFITAINVMCFTRMPSKFTITPSCWSRNNCFFYSSLIYTLLGSCLYPAVISFLKVQGTTSSFCCVVKITEFAVRSIIIFLINYCFSVFFLFSVLPGF